MIKDSGDRTEFETGAKRDMHAGKGRMDLLPWYGIMEVSKHCEEGALKYGEHNVDKGIPLHSLLDSASRHLAKYMVGMDDEDHLIKVSFPQRGQRARTSPLWIVHSFILFQLYSGIPKCASQVWHLTVTSLPSGSS